MADPALKGPRRLAGATVPDLVEALGGASTPTWPPAGRIADYLRAIEEPDAEELEAERTGPSHCAPWSDPSQIGERPIRIRLPVHETMRIVQAVLVECADQIAGSVQRCSPPASRRPTGADAPSSSSRTGRTPAAGRGPAFGRAPARPPYGSSAASKAAPAPSGR
ncbi:hypothetical protein ACIGDI_39595 [Streptomyces sp. NPDC085900]|uniref:hypothetical protein n=1 Tax=Streptomyces sp. NPDC085900 TaxID=3365737 RepID=UPI0037D1F809